MIFRNWIILISLVLTTGLIIDAVRRTWNQHRLKKNIQNETKKDLSESFYSEQYINELPNGGARLCMKQNHFDERSTINEPNTKPEYSENIDDFNLFTKNKDYSQVEFSPFFNDNKNIKAQINIHENSLNNENDKNTNLFNYEDSLHKGTSLETKASNDYKLKFRSLINKNKKSNFLNEVPVKTQKKLREQIAEISSNFSAKLNKHFKLESKDMSQLNSQEKSIEDQAYKAKKQDQDQDQDQNELLTNFLIIHVKAKKDQFLSGDSVLQVLMDHGLRLGEMNVFHFINTQDGKYHYDDALFSVVNGMEPGYFNLNTIRSDQFKVLTFIMRLSGSQSGVTEFKTMIDTIDKVSNIFNANVCDENHCIMTLQMLEYYLEKVSNHQRLQLMEHST